MLKLRINGEPRPLELEEPATLEGVLTHLGVQLDRVAVELNDAIVARTEWAQTPIHQSDRLEIVHFVGGGSATAATIQNMCYRT